MIKFEKKLFILVNLFFFYFIFLNNVIADDFKKFLSLKNNEVNLRQGPSKEHPIKLVYKKKFLPVQILDSWENWRKISDFENNNGWIHISLLSGKKSAININNNSIIFNSNTIYSKPIAKVQKGRLFLIKKCKYGWCKVSSEKYTGWIKKKFLWGSTN